MNVLIPSVLIRAELRRDLLRVADDRHADAAPRQTHARPKVPLDDERPTSAVSSAAVAALAVDDALVSMNWRRTSGSMRLISRSAAFHASSSVSRTSTWQRRPNGAVESTERGVALPGRASSRAAFDAGERVTPNEIHVGQLRGDALRVLAVSAEVNRHRLWRDGRTIAPRNG